MIKLLVTILCLVLLNACVSKGESRPNIVEAQHFINKANSSEAVQYAPLELRFAREKLVAAQAAADQGKEAQAIWLAEEASLNAELAIAKVEASKARNDMLAASDVCDALRTQAQDIIAEARGIK